jgi:CDP-diacylglycerol---glycerol-3-phosphate 3-phosphatidyltransferase
MKPQPAGSIPASDWRTKPTDRFILRWLKIHLAAPISPRIARLGWVRPWMVTLLSAAIGIAAGVALAGRLGWLAAVLACASQVLDAVDGQVARLTGRVSRRGAYWDSVLDRYVDGSMVLGMILYLWPGVSGNRQILLAVLGGLALIGSNLISYGTARAGSLGLDLGPPTRVSKGARMSLMILAALATTLWSGAAWVALAVLAAATQAVTLQRLARVKPLADGRGREV